MKESDYLKDSAEFLAKMKSFPGFEPLDEDQLVEVLAVTKVQRYDPGETIIREGDFDNRVFFLIQGMVRVLAGDQELGQMRRLGDVFGEMGVIDGSARSATIQAIQETLCLCVDASCLDRIKGDAALVFQAVIYRIFAEKLAVRVRTMNREITMLREALLDNDIRPPELDDED